MYLLNDGTEVTATQIKNAFENEKAVLVRSRAVNHTATGLLLDGKHWDNRGENYSVWDDSWTAAPDSYKDALNAAYCKS